MSQILIKKIIRIIREKREKDISPKVIILSEKELEDLKKELLKVSNEASWMDGLSEIFGLRIISGIEEIIKLNHETKNR